MNSARLGTWCDTPHAIRLPLRKRHDFGTPLRHSALDTCNLIAIKDDEEDVGAVRVPMTGYRISLMPRLHTASILFLVFAFTTTAAGAVSKQVKEACRNDYRAYCSAFEVGSQELRSCMRASRAKLSKTCARALRDAGEATEEDIRAYKRARRK